MVVDYTKRNKNILKPSKNEPKKENSNYGVDISVGGKKIKSKFFRLLFALYFTGFSAFVGYSLLSKSSDKIENIKNLKISANEAELIFAAIVIFILFSVGITLLLKTVKSFSEPSLSNR